MCASGVVSARGGKTGWVKLPVRPGDDYIPRFGWVDAKHAVDRNPHPRPQAPRPLLRRCRHRQVAPDAARSTTTNSSTTTTTSGSSDGIHRPHQLDRRPQPALSLQLRHARNPMHRARQAGAAAHQRRFRGERRLPRRLQATGSSTTPPTRAICWSSSCGRSDFDGAAQAAEHRRRLPRRQLCARRHRVRRHGIPRAWSRPR